MMNRQLIVFCRNYQQELESLNLPAKYKDLQIAFFPSRCGMPPVDWETIKKDLPGEEADYSELHVVSCGGIKGLPDKQKIADRHYDYDFKQCFHLITSPDLVEDYIKKGFYLVTPGWLKHWRDILAQWGFDQKTARNFFMESARAVLLLDTGVDPEAETNLAEFASYVGRPKETTPVGLVYLDLLLSNTVLKSRDKTNGNFENGSQNDYHKELADFSMALDLLNSLTRLRSEDQVLVNIRDLFTMLFAPRVVNFKPAAENTPVNRSERAENEADGFVVPVYGSGGLLGEIEAIGLNQPQNREQYKNLANRIVNICGLAIENARHYQRIKELSDTDGLTGLANRRKLEEHLSREWKRLQREQKPLSLLMCDIDFFKNYNDLYGHQAGDDCLRAIASVLIGYSRRSGDLPARYGGEEFMLVLPGVDLKDAEHLAGKIRQSAEALNLKHEDSRCSKFVTLSIGVASVIPSAENSIEKLIASADKALYAAKQAGRNQIIVT